MTEEKLAVYEAKEKKTEPKVDAAMPVREMIDEMPVMKSASVSPWTRRLTRLPNRTLGRERRACSGLRGARLKERLLEHDLPQAWCVL